MAVASPLALLASALVATVLFAALKLYRHRRFYRDLPMPPYSFFWGHLQVFGKAMRVYPEGVHPQLPFTYIAQTYNLPEVFFIDLWPMGPVFTVLTSPEAAQHVVQSRGYGKHAMIEEMMTPMVGKGSIVGINGPPWKSVHQMLVPAFRPSAVRGMLAQVAEETLIFRTKLDGLAREESIFKAETIFGRLIFDIICRVVLGKSVGAMEDGSPLMEDLKTPIDAWSVADRSSNPILKFRMRRKGNAALKRSEKLLTADVLTRYRALKMEDTRVSGCLLDAILIDRIQEEEKGRAPIDQDAAWVTDLLVQLRSVLFGGFGTTTDTLCFMSMLLSLNPDKLQKLREEHDRICGPRVADAVTMVQNEPHRTAELEYTTAVIKETLRMYPIGFTIRQDDKDGGWMTYKSQKYPTANTIVAIPGHTMHYNPEIYPEPAKFQPERWLGAAGQAIPRNAWRPFELGPRGCMGRELAMDEMRVVTLLTVRWFDFVITDDGSGVTVPRETPRVGWTDLDTLVGDLAFQDVGLEAKPRGGMPMRVKRTERPL